jgi:hypothetical protein
MCQSNQTTQFKFRYVFDVYIYGLDPIRFKTPPNPEGVGVIDVAGLVAAQIQIPENIPFIETTPFFTGDYLASTVYILVGEEYATTATGPTTIYNGYGVPGEPTFPMYADGAFAPCPNPTTPVIAWASGQGANENYDYMESGGEAILPYVMDGMPAGNGKFLTRCPNNPQNIRSDEQFSLTWLNYNLNEEISADSKVPYAMRASIYNGSTLLGYNDTYNTTANGGDGWSSCSTFVGVTGDDYWLQNFTINMSDVDEYTRYQEQLFTYTGCEAEPIGDVFPFEIETDLTPPANLPIGNHAGNQVNTFGLTGATGYSKIIFIEQDLCIGGTLNIVIPSSNTIVFTFPEIQLWGVPNPGDPDDPDAWEYIAQFSKRNVGGNWEYYLNLTIPPGTTSGAYEWVGLRWFKSSTADKNGFYGCFFDQWNLTCPLTESFDKVCLQLHAYDDSVACTLGVVLSEQICLTINDDNCWGFEPIRFAFRNNLGGWDWYTFIKRNTFTQSAERQQLYKLPGYWSAANWNVKSIQPARYGTTTFDVSLQNTWTASTDWLTEAESSWLRGMFASPQVIAYLPGRSQPVAVNINDASYAVQTIRRENLFQYFVTFTEAQPDVVQSY